MFAIVSNQDTDSPLNSKFNFSIASIDRVYHHLRARAANKSSFFVMKNVSKSQFQCEKLKKKTLTALNNNSASERLGLEVDSHFESTKPAHQSCVQSKWYHFFTLSSWAICRIQKKKNETKQNKQIT